VLLPLLGQHLLRFRNIIDYKPFWGFIFLAPFSCRNLHTTAPKNSQPWNKTKGRGKESPSPSYRTFFDHRTCCQTNIQHIRSPPPSRRSVAQIPDPVQVPTEQPARPASFSSVWRSCRSHEDCCIRRNT